MRGNTENLRLPRGSQLCNTQWDRVAHLRKKGEVTTFCQLESVLPIQRADVIAGIYPLCNGCFLS